MIMVMSRCINVCASMSDQLHLRYVGGGPILHAFTEPQELDRPVFYGERRQVASVLVSDVKYSPITIQFTSGWDKLTAL